MTKTKINTGAAVENHRQKDQGNVSPKWIEAIQRQVKIGDTVNVKTNKCCSVDEGMSGKSGVWRKGTVIGIFRNFVHAFRAVYAKAFSGQISRTAIRRMTMKKNNDTPKEQFICSVCGKEISGDHVIIQTRRHTTLHIHYECMRAGRKE